MSRRVGLVVGDTPGHFYPALAVAQAFRRRSDSEITFFGPALGHAEALAARHGCDFQPVSSSAIARVGFARVVAAGARTLLGIVEARRVLKRARIGLVVSFGSFASGAVVLAARSLGCRSAIHEANVTPGIANRLLGRVADRIYVSAWATGTHFPPARMVVTGWPVRDDVNALATMPRVPPTRGSLRMLVCSGSRGGAFFANAIPRLAARLASSGLDVEICHQAGDADVAALRAAYARLGVSAEVVPLIAEMADAYRWANLVIARAGAGTIAELALAALPSFLVPLPDSANGHQILNAKAFAETGAALWTTEVRWNDDAVLAQLSDLLQPDAWTAASTTARRFATPAAAESVVEACELLLESAR